MTTELRDIGDLITFPPERYGRPCLAGTGMYVFRVVDMHRMNLSPEAMHAEFPHVPLSHFYAALAFYYANRQWCDEQMQLRDGAAEQAYISDAKKRAVRAG